MKDGSGGRLAPPEPYKKPTGSLLGVGVAGLDKLLQKIQVQRGNASVTIQIACLSAGTGVDALTHVRLQHGDVGLVHTAVAIYVSEAQDIDSELRHLRLIRRRGLGIWIEQRRIERMDAGGGW